MKKFKVFSMAAVALLALVAFAPVSYANVLIPGAAGLPDVFVAADGTGGGVIMADTGVEAYAIKDALGGTHATGNFREIVVTDTVTGNLDFIYEFEVLSAAPTDVIRMTTINFANAATDVGYCSDCLDVIDLNAAGDANAAPTGVDRSLDGTTVGFSFATPGVLGPGGDTFDLVIKTDAKTVARGSTSLIDGGTTNMDTFAPAPEPMYAGLMLSGLFGFGLLVARRFQAKQG